jgi:regulator of protease activity HflC (stomatin/prohibitin superfamily)
MNKNKISLAIGGALSFIMLIIVLTCTERIDAGHEGLLVKMYGSDKGVQDVALVTGRVWYNPLTEQVFEVPTYVQTINYQPFTVNAKDGSVFTVDPTMSLKVIDGQSPKIFKKYRKNIDEVLQNTLVNHIKDVYRIEFNKYTTDSIISRREAFENGVQDNPLMQKMQRYKKHNEWKTN